MPTAFFHVWDWFWALSSRRGSSDTGAPQPLQCKEIEGWDSLLSGGIRPAEIEMILAMDAAFLTTTLEEHNAVSELARSKEASKPRSKRLR